MKYNNSKCKIRHLGKNNPLDQCKLEINLLESSSVEKDLESLANNKKFMSQQCSLEAMKANRIVPCTRKSIASRLRLPSTHPW